MGLVKQGTLYSYNKDYPSDTNHQSHILGMSLIKISEPTDQRGTRMTSSE